MKQKHFIPFFLMLLCINCMRPTHSRKTQEAIIDVTNERLYLAPLINKTGFEKMPNWPQTSHEQKALLKNLSTIWKELKSEFRRCEKFSNYKIVENDEDPSIRISITLNESTINNDSLFIPVEMQVERIPDGKFYIYTISTSAIIPLLNSANSNTLYNFGTMLSGYRRNFPYQSIVSFFYAH